MVINLSPRNQFVVADWWCEIVRVLMEEIHVPIRRWRVGSPLDILARNIFHRKWVIHYQLSNGFRVNSCLFFKLILQWNPSKSVLLFVLIHHVLYSDSILNIQKEATTCQWLYFKDKIQCKVKIVIYKHQHTTCNLMSNICYSFLLFLYIVCSIGNPWN